MNKTRITSARTRKGDSGRSEVLEGYTLPKSHQIILLQSYIQLLMVWTTRINIKYGSLLDDKDLKILVELKSICCNNLGTSVYKKLTPDEVFLPIELKEKIETRINEIKKAIPNAPEFVVPSTLQQCDFMEYMIWERITEHYLWVMVDNIFFLPENQSPECKIITSTYNALSDYIFQLMRYLTYKNNEVETYWNNPLDNI